MGVIPSIEPESLHPKPRCSKLKPETRLPKFQALNSYMRRVTGGATNSECCSTAIESLGAGWLGAKS